MSTDSISTVEQFYQTVFPWQLNPTPDSTYKFVGVEGFEGNAGGIYDNKGAEANWSIYCMMVEDVDEVCRQVVDEGGLITYPTEVNDDEHGVMKAAQFEDPSGNRFAVVSFTPKS
ncbi:VOC family protein [Amycolatopsis sp. CA-230715]|uniref:VOC family protein n=1 Tax=Amycolatopsis sp. CA-230715 TaxID=2745196 RepID=UPI001C00F743|nr:VOC family protein [Amycolatopsis sp. CA-230715]